MLFGRSGPHVLAPSIGFGTIVITPVPKVPARLARQPHADASTLVEAHAIAHSYWWEDEDGLCRSFEQWFILPPAPTEYEIQFGCYRVKPSATAFPKRLPVSDQRRPSAEERYEILTIDSGDCSKLDDPIGPGVFFETVQEALVQAGATRAQYVSASCHFDEFFSDAASIQYLRDSEIQRPIGARRHWLESTTAKGSTDTAPAIWVYGHWTRPPTHDLKELGVARALTIHQVWDGKRVELPGLRVGAAHTSGARPALPDQYALHDVGSWALWVQRRMGEDSEDHRGETSPLIATADVHLWDSVPAEYPGP